MKKYLVGISLSLLFSQASYSADKVQVYSQASLSGECGAVERVGQNNVAESAIVGIVATAVISESISYVAKWFGEIKDKFKGSDTATNVDFFYCKDVQKQGGKIKSNDKGDAIIDHNSIGIREDLVYERYTEIKEPSDKANAIPGKKTQIKIVSKVKLLKGAGENVGFFTITPHSIDYQTPIAKLGKEKDIAVVYAFTFYDKTGGEKTITSDPILFESVKVGTKKENLQSLYGTKAIFPLPSLISVNKTNEIVGETPFKLSIQVSEVSAGKGSELVGNIAKAIGESIDKENDSLTKMVVEKLIEDDGDKSLPGGAGDKKSGGSANPTAQDKGQSPLATPGPND